jgi:predicted metal-dependent HD superfamily phosphohydrolase
MQLYQISKIVFNQLKLDLSPLLIYHNYQHSKSVFESTKLIAESESLSSKQKKIVLTAALFHDTGFINNPESIDHEDRSCDYASNILPFFNYKFEEIKEINRCIMSTKLPQTPDGYLSEILCDADLFYLGTEKYDRVSHNFFLELKNFDKIKNEKEWLIKQVEFLERHHYFTKFAKEKLDPIKQKNLRAIKKQL